MKEELSLVYPTKKVFLEYIRRKFSLPPFFPDKLPDLKEWKVIPAEVLEELYLYHSNLGASSFSLRNIAILNKPRSFLVISGQQPHFLSGPLFVIYKIISVIKWAKLLKDKHKDYTFVPAFWLASQDTNWENNSYTFFFNRKGEPRKITLKKFLRKRDYQNMALGEIKLDKEIKDKLLFYIKMLLFPSEFRDELISTIESSFDKSKTFSSFVAAILLRLFSSEGLVIIDANLNSIKKNSVPILTRYIENLQEVHDLVKRGGEELKKLGLAKELPIEKKKDNCFFFIKEDKKRQRLIFQNDKFMTVSCSASFDKEEMKEKLVSNYSDFYTNVCLQPLVRDSIFSTSVYIPGPQELAYLAQLYLLYSYFNITRPYIIPRISATLIEPKIKKIIIKYNLLFSSLFKETEEEIANKIIQERYNITHNLDKAKKIIRSTVEELKESLRRVDVTLKSPSEKLVLRIEKELNKFGHKVIKHKIFQVQILKRQIKRAKLSILPDKDLQERKINIFYFLAKYGGKNFIKELIEIIPSESTHHFLIDIT